MQSVSLSQPTHRFGTIVQVLTLTLSTALLYCSTGEAAGASTLILNDLLKRRNKMFFFLQNDRIIQSMDSPSSISKRFTISCLLSDETIRLHWISTESSIRLKHNLHNCIGKLISTPYHLIVCNMTCNRFIGKVIITCIIAKEGSYGCMQHPCHHSPLAHSHA